MRDILGLDKLVGEEELARFNLSAQMYLVTFWNTVEQEFNHATEIAGDEEAGCSRIISNPQWLFMAMVLRDSLLMFNGGEEFWSTLKPRRRHHLMYTMLHSRELYEALKDSEREWEEIHGVPKRAKGPNER